MRGLGPFRLWKELNEAGGGNRDQATNAGPKMNSRNTEIQTAAPQQPVNVSNPGYNRQLLASGEEGSLKPWYLVSLPRTCWFGN